MAGKLDGKRIAILANDGIEQVELTEPRKALEEAGARPTSSPRSGRDPGLRPSRPTPTRSRSTRRSTTSSADDYDGLLIPGGVANRDLLAPTRTR